MAEERARLTFAGKLISTFLILGLIATGVYVIKKRGGLGGGGSSDTTAEGEAQTEAPDTKGVTTVSEYKYVPGDKLPAVKGVSQYKWDPNQKILRFSYNVWGGWLPVIAANHGTKPNADSVFSKKYGFKVEMVLMDDPVVARDAFAAGEVQTLWGTVDMMTLFAPELGRDSRTSPRIMQQIDWSSGGDGIVVRNTIKSVSDLKGKTITLAQNSPSEYYLNSLLLSAGLRPSDVKVKYTATAFEAAAAFVADKKVDACVSWAPDIYNITERVAGTRILSSTADANKLIADVYAVRADFAKDHPDVVEGLIAGIFEGMDMVREKPEEPAKWMADAFGMKPDEVMSMRNDSHLTNFPENVQFFLNASNPTNFERTWKGAAYVYRELGRISAPVQFDQVMDFSAIQALQKKGAFAHQADESQTSFTPASYRKMPAEAPILTQTIRINFFPNSANPYEPARNEFDKPIAGKLYDPNVDATLEQVARLSGQFERAVILIEGHADSSMKGKVPVQAVRDLSLARAEAIKRALIDKYKFDPNKFSIEGKGWDVPADMAQPENQALNRRVEISVYPPEQK
ncbi:MAG TPA: phosphate ABC transporter substrate-binding/OmpA family protein [Terriglobia bacterium]|nr:phosphate ABC transporter substrate-binding/OmpA family protein [Terriglobia bacterium]